MFTSYFLKFFIDIYFSNIRKNFLNTDTFFVHYGKKRKDNVYRRILSNSY